LPAPGRADPAAVPPVPGVYHTHTFRCQHATGDVVDFARTARDAGMIRLGAADHTPIPDGRWARVRMREDQLADYEAAVVAARVAVPEVEVLLGMECDLDPLLLSWYRDTYPARGYRYLIGSCHYVSREGVEVSAFDGCTGSEALRDYAARLVAGIASGLFAFIGHPDNTAACNKVWTPDLAACATDICAAAAAHRVPLEINSLGLRERRGYPWRPFWEIAAAHHCQTVLSTDAHHPHHLTTGLDEAAVFARELGLTIVDPFAPSAGA
jgi:histidinol-phosphatase (PHP family)